MICEKCWSDAYLAGGETHMISYLRLLDERKDNPCPRINKLPSGFWHARWSSEVWAQWPPEREVTLEDFFHHTGTEARIAQINRAIANE